MTVGIAVVVLASLASVLPWWLAALAGLWALALGDSRVSAPQEPPCVPLSERRSAEVTVLIRTGNVVACVSGGALAEIDLPAREGVLAPDGSVDHSLQGEVLGLNRRALPSGER